MRFAMMMLALVAFTASAQTADDVYAEGKALYDSKQYDAALAKFDECARLEPEKARWQYNRGLALRKLKRDSESRAAFLESLRLDPTYKEKEIREKLGDLGPPPSSSDTSSSPSDGTSAKRASDEGFGWICFGLVGALAAAWAFFRFGVQRGPSSSSGAPASQRAPSRSPMDEATRLGLLRRLEATGTQLGRLEHGMSLGEDPQARANLDRAYTNFQQARRTMAGGKNVPEEITAALDRADAAARNTEARLRSLHGAALDSAKGPAAGCFFCARPLPTPASQQPVTLQVRAQQTTVAACTLCARRVAAGDAPPVAAVNGRHWASMQGIDPYVFGYSNVVDPETLPLWQLSRQGLDVGQLASLAGAAVVGGAAGAVAAKLLDVDALSESAVASEAAAAAARSASGRRDERTWQDNS